MKSRLAALSVVGCVVLAVWWVGNLVGPDAIWQPLPIDGDPVLAGAQASTRLWLLRLAVVSFSFLVAKAVSGTYGGAIAIALTLGFSLGGGRWSGAGTAALTWTVVWLCVVGAGLWWARRAEPTSPRRRETSLARLLVVTVVGGIGVAMLIRFSAGVWAPPRLIELVQVIAADLDLLGGALVLVGGVALRRRVSTAMLLGGWCLTMLLVLLVWDAPDWKMFVVLLAVPLWMVAAAGAGWVIASAQGRWTRWGVTALVLCLPAMSLAAQATAVARANGLGRFVDRYFERLDELMPPGIRVVEQGGLVGERLRTPRSDAAFGTQVIPSDPARLESALAEGVPVVAFAAARQNLRELGFRFRTITDAGVFMTLPELLSTVPAGWIVAVAATPQFPLAVAPDPLETFAQAGGRQRVFGQAGKAYVLIGARGRGASRYEQLGTGAQAIAIKAGSLVTRGVRVPVNLAVRAEQGRAEIEYRGQTVAVSETGIAVAIISPAGRLEAAYAPEFDRDLRVRVNPPTLHAGALIGREPCQTLGPVWADVGASARSASLGALLDAGQTATLYLAATHPLVPHQAQLNQVPVPSVTVRAFDRERPDDRLSLTDWLRRDEVDSGVADVLGASSHVYRVDVSSPSQGASQLALRLGGFPTALVARTSTPLTVCAAMRPEADLLDVNLERDDLFLYGWNAVERTNQGPFRWTRANRAQLVLPVTEPANRVVTITARPLVEGDTAVTLWVNGRPLGRAVQEDPTGASTREFLWEVPAAIWRAGMNRLQVGVSRLGRPSELSRGDDDRLLGVAVERISVRRAQ